MAKIKRPEPTSDRPRTRRLGGRWNRYEARPPNAGKPVKRALIVGLASRLEDRDTRSKWDWVTLAAGMAVAALLAGGGAVYFSKQQLDTANFQDAIRLIQNDDRNYWCGTAAQAPVITDREGLSYCAVQMPNYVTPEEGGEAASE